MSLFFNIPEQYRFLPGKCVTTESLRRFVHDPTSTSFEPLAVCLAKYGITDCNFGDNNSILESLTKMGLKIDNYVICLTPDWAVKGTLTICYKQNAKIDVFYVDYFDTKIVLLSFGLRIGETIELKCPFMVPRLNSDEYWNASMSVPGGLFLSGTVQVFQSCDLYHTGIEGMTSRALLWFSILTDFWLFSKWLLNSSLGYRNTYLCFYKPY